MTPELQPVSSDSPDPTSAAMLRIERSRVSQETAVRSARVAVGGATLATVGALLIALISVGINFLAYATGAPESETAVRPIILPEGFWVGLLITCALIAISGTVYFSLRRRWQVSLEARRLDLREKESAAIESAAERLREKMELPSLVELNRLMLDQYHDIATAQADSSFKTGRRAMGTGFGWLLVCFSVPILYPPAAETQLLIGSLGVAGGALAAFLGRTYIRVYERSLAQLNRYFEQPLLNSYLLSAERIVGQISTERRDEANILILNRLLGAELDSKNAAEAANAPKLRLRRRSTNGQETTSPATTAPEGV